MILSRLSPAIPSAALLAAALLLPCKVEAGASNKNGNPFGNGTFFNTTGTFSAVVRGQNLSGTIVFSSGLDQSAVSSVAGTSGGLPNLSGGGGSSNVSTLPKSSGSMTVVYQGNTYFGNSTGMWDPSSGMIEGQFWGGQTLSGTNGSQIWPEMYNTNFPYVVQYLSNTVTNVQLVQVDPTTGFATTNAYLTNLVTTNYLSVAPTGTNVFQDSVYMNGNFSGQVQNKYPNQTFNALGTVTQEQLAADPTNGTVGEVPKQMAVPLTIPVAVTGLRIADAYTTYTTISNAVPYTQTAYSITNIPNKQGGLGGSQ